MIVRLAGIAALVVTLAGCETTTIDQSACAKMDWYALGLADGRAGYPSERIVEHRKACAGANVEPDEMRYLTGRRAGLAEYCQPDNAFRDGLAGNEYRGGCNATFARSQQAAYRVYTATRALERNRGDIGWREAEISGNRASDDRRAQLRQDLADLYRQRKALQDELAVAQQDFERLRLSQASAPPVPAAGAPGPTSKPAPPAVTVGPAGTATGTLTVGNDVLSLRHAYAFVAPDSLDQLKRRPILVLTESPIAPATLAGAPDLDRVLGTLPAYVMVIRNEATPPKVALVVWHPGLGASPAVAQDAGKAGAVKLEAYGPARIAGTLSSPQGGKAAFTWNKRVRLVVRFDAPLSRSWPP